MQNERSMIEARGRGSRRVHILALAVLMAGGVGCSQQIDTTLVAAEGSQLQLRVPAVTGRDSTPSLFSGGIEATASVDISFFDLLFGRPLAGTLEIDDVLLSGSNALIPFGSFVVGSGNICVSPADPAAPGGGDLEIDLKNRELRFDVAADTVVQVTDPFAGNLLGVTPFPFDVSATSPVSLFDLIGALGGGALPLAVTVDIDETIPNPGFVEGVRAFGQVVLEGASEIPQTDDLTACESFLAAP